MQNPFLRISGWISYVKQLGRLSGGRAVALLSGSTALGQALTLIASPILTRIFTPEDFGCLSIFSAFLSIAAVVAAFRYDIAITQVPENESRACLFSLAVIISAVVSCCILFGLHLFSERLSDAFSTPQMEDLWWLLGIGSFAAGVYNSAYYIALSRKDYFCLAKSRLLQGFASPFSAIVIGYWVGGPVGLIIGQLASTSAGASVLLKKTSLSSMFLGISSRKLFEIANRYRSYPIFSTPGAVLNSIGLVSGPLILAKLYGVEVAGFYALAHRVVSAPLSVIGTSIGQVFLSEASSIWQSKEGSIAPLTQKTKRKLFPLVIAVLVLGAATPWLFPLLFGEQWRTAGMFSAILSVQAAAQLFTTPISTMVFILNRQGTQLILDIVRVLLMLGAIGACRYFSADPLYAVLFSSLSMTTVYVVSSIWYHSLVAETSKELQTKPKLCEARVNNTEES